MHVDALAAAAVATDFPQSGIDRSKAAGVFGVELGALRDQVLHDIVPAPERGAVKQSCAALRIGGVDITARFQQKIERSDCPLLDVFRREPASGIGID